MLKQRIITALLLAPIVLCIIIFGGVKWLLLLTAVIQLAAIYEWLRISLINKPQSLFLSAIITAITAYYCWLYQLPQELLTGGFILIWLPALLWLKQNRKGHQKQQQASLGKATLGILAISLFAISFNTIGKLQAGNWWALALLLSIWVADVGAYFSGKQFGKHKLAGKISPGKTVEGVIGAQLTVFIYALIVSNYLAIIHWQAALLFISVTLFSIIGDLAASLGKRQANIKDSSNLLPGHGGFIDRFDSLIAATPLFLILLTLIL